MTAVCAWCQKVIHGGGGRPQDVSHGICPACEQQLLEDAAMSVSWDDDNRTR